ncbi:hypothetical protein C8A05DRAFT_20071 [Staphylotrichum tortipilum]|uniref:Uncharacterized protein n=1 Tax=Staphylotrichum tortipilum TaxID=2831512 RepID=A0AAN6MA00_9PEZI|nr:hypothetical protein C8A05DRAFT_20071 [Staphylotrichum longicolle]
MNNASPLHQGCSNPTHPNRRAHRIWAKTHPDVCGNPKCDRPRPEKYHWMTWEGFKEGSRCPKCARHLKKHGMDDPKPRAWRTAAAHKEWLKNPANKDVCSLCGARRPKVGGDWTGWCDQARCSRCRKPQPPARRNGTLREHQDWLAETGNPDVCGRCGVKRPVDYQEKHWIGFFDTSRCPNCRYQDKKDRQLESPKPPSTGPKMVRITEEQHIQWVREGNPDVCVDCNTPRPDNFRALAWRGFRENSRCRRYHNKHSRAASAARKAAAAVQGSAT